MKELNRKKTCLIIVDSYPPVIGAGAKRMATLSKYLTRLGWKVYVLTIEEGYRSYIESNRYFIPENIKLIRTKAFYPVIKNLKSSNINIKVKKALRRLFHSCGFPDYLVGWIPFCVVTGCTILKKEDINIIYSSSPRVSSHVIALLLKRIAHKPWLAEFRDPVTANPSSFNNILQYLFGKKIEKEILRECDAVISISEILDRQFKNIYPYNHSKFHIILNGFDPEIHSEQVYKDKDNRIFNISYTGAFYPLRGSVPDFLLKAVSTLLKKGAIEPERIKICFYGGFPKQSFKLIENMSLSQIISVGGYVGLRDSIQIQQESDLLLLFTGYKKGHEWETTAKIFEYLNSRKPILAMTCENSHAKEIIESTNTGKCVVGNSVEDIADAVLNYYNEFHNNNGYINYFPKYEQVRKYDYSKLIKQLDNIMNGIIHN